LPGLGEGGEKSDVPHLSAARQNPAESLAAARLSYRWCQRWTETLTRLRRQFDGDLDQYLLLLVFEQGEMARAVSCLEGTVRKSVAVRAEPRGMNAMSVAEICGIPRESARRKLKRLIERQAIELGPDGLYYLGARRLVAPPVALLGSLGGYDEDGFERALANGPR
jgi:hypothetical protein